MGEMLRLQFRRSLTGVSETLSPPLPPPHPPPPPPPPTLQHTLLWLHCISKFIDFFWKGADLTRSKENVKTFDAGDEKAQSSVSPGK